MKHAAILLSLLVAGCATAPKPVVEAPPVAAPGMERLLGRETEAAVALLGAATLDRREGPARQLQFAGACILDLFYYPSAGTVPVATYAEARLPDGRSFPAGECLSLLLRSKPR